MKKKQDSTAAPPSMITPPRESQLSMVLNGAGNGSMVAGAIVGGYEFFKAAPETIVKAGGREFKATIFAAVVGAGIGAVFGYREADRLHAYRQQLADEINDLKHQVQGQGESIGNWTRRHEELHAAEAKKVPELG